MLSRHVEYTRDLLVALVSKELKVRYKSTFLGYFWSLLNPIVFASVFYFVFKYIQQNAPDNYLLFLLSGLFPWQAFSNSVGGSGNAFLGNSNLIKKTRFPRFLLVIASILNEQFHFCLSLILLTLLVVIEHQQPLWQGFWVIPFLILFQSIFNFGVSLIVATGNLFFRDLDRLIGYLVMLWFYLTPIVYSVDRVRNGNHWWKPIYLYCNPMTPIITTWQALILNTPVPWDSLIAAAVCSIVTAIIGYAFYRKMQWRFAEVV